MKPFRFALCLLFGSLIYSNLASAQATTEAKLQQMGIASQTLNYELAFINANKTGIESLRYRHAHLSGKSLAQLLQMDGPRREVLLRGNEISYFEGGLEPFTISGDHIVDSFPAVVFADFKLLSQYYNFIPVGRMRVVDRPCEVVRIVARDGSRYSYVVWLDEETRLPLRIDLMDREGDTLEQFRVISFSISPDIQTEMAKLTEVVLPPVLITPPAEKVSFQWQVKWVPPGFKEISRSRRNLPTLSESIESRLFSDGLFSFSINVSQIGSATAEQMIRQGRRTIHTETRNNKEIMVVGELPPSTAKRIAADVAVNN